MHDLAALGNRLRKLYRIRRGWAKRAGIEAYRLYDGDIPELRYVVDLYKDHGVIFDRSDDRESTGDDTASAIQDEVAMALGLPLAQVHFKQRRRMPGALQYEKLGKSGKVFPVAEETSRYLVNVTDYLDTGLFLDHRPLRSRFRKLPPGQRLLNLFCYTGSVSVAAAQAGAVTTSVDLSNTYLDWAVENFKANDLPLMPHTFVREDVLQFLAAGLGRERPYDIVFLDPPTFSNSKRMDGTFDVQRDHVQLLQRAMGFVAPGGVLYFSTNRRRFVLDDGIKSRFAAEDISDATIPEDFRDRKIHRCFTLVPVTRSVTGTESR